jgi:hypothetical protein
MLVLPELDRESFDGFCFIFRLQLEAPIMSRATPLSSSSLQVAICRNPFEEAIRQVLAGKFALASFRRRQVLESEEAMIRNWRIMDECPDFERQRIFFQGAVMFSGPDRLEVIRRIKPTAGQSLLLLELLDHRDISGLRATIHERDSERQIDSIRLIGPELLCCHPANSRKEEPESGNRRSPIARLAGSRIAGALGKTVHRRVTRLSIAQVGMGAGGQEIARQFASLGVQRLTLLDDARIGYENQGTLPWASDRDCAIKRHKVDIALRELHRLRPRMHLTGLRQRVQSPQARHHLLHRRYDLISVFADSLGAPIAAAELSRDTLTPLLVTGTHIERLASGTAGRTMVSRADIRLFLPYEGCPACGPTMDPTLLRQAEYEAYQPAGTMSMGPPRRWNQLRAGSLPNVNAAAASCAVDLLIRFLSGDIRTSYWIQLHGSANGWRYEERPITAAAKCRFCHPED